MIKLELSNVEAKLLAEHLAAHIDRMQRELAGTESRKLQHDIATDLDALTELHRRVQHRLAAPLA